ncbi:MAG: HAMP domain-containing histidine kinase [Acidobacteria bacterium]|nr:HAMP domain-containing histidine kinase [Acidobacteriota bacterium]
MVGRSVDIQLRKEIAENLHNSVVVFRDFQRQREIAMASTARLLANLPSLKALMTTRDAATIQDASAGIWRSAPSDVFVLADPTGKVMAIHTTTPGFTGAAAEQLLKKSWASDQPSFWWYGSGHLYQVFLQPIYFGAPAGGSVLGVLGVGHEISEELASHVSRIASSEVAFFYGDTLIVSTVKPVPAPLQRETGPAEKRLADETFLATTVQLAPDIPPYVRLTVLKSIDKASAFLVRLNQVLLALGVSAVFAGSLVVFLVSYTFTKPLGDLVKGVRAVEAGNFAYPLSDRKGDEIAELTAAFTQMRRSLQRTERELLASERLATIGRTASSLSHDLRHPLTAVVANAEFLCDRNLDLRQREELYAEIRTAVDQVTDLLDSLLEFSQAQESLRPVFGSVEDSVERALRKVQAHPVFHASNITVSRQGNCQTSFDQKKVERALVNLLLNACESISRDSGQVEVDLREADDRIEIRIVDNGPGVPESIREKLFQPFVSYGKQNGTGLGLAIAQKIFQDHGGDAWLESTAPGRTVFTLILPVLIRRFSNESFGENSDSDSAVAGCAGVGAGRRRDSEPEATDQRSEVDARRNPCRDNRITAGIRSNPETDRGGFGTK